MTQPKTPTLLFVFSVYFVVTNPFRICAHLC